jgi:hypothetical protein
MNNSLIKESCDKQAQCLRCTLITDEAPGSCNLHPFEAPRCYLENYCSGIPNDTLVMWPNRLMEERSGWKSMTHHYGRDHALVHSLHENLKMCTPLHTRPHASLPPYSHHTHTDASSMDCTDTMSALSRITILLTLPGTVPVYTYGPRIIIKSTPLNCF